MPISINGTGTITGLSAGGLPDDSIVTADIANSAVTTAKVNDSAITSAKVNDSAITYAKLSTSATEADNVAKRTAKAWVNFNGTGTVAIRDDFNVSSITDNGTGDYTVNFSSSLDSANYCAVMSQQPDPANGPDTSAVFYGRTPNTTSAPTTSGFRISCINTAGNGVDRAYVMVAVFL